MSLQLWPEGAPNAMGASPEDQPTLTPYLVQSDKPTAAMIVCPGGAYKVLADHEGEPIAKWLNGIGISAFVLKYRIAPYKHPNPLLDAQRAIRYVRHNAVNWNIDTNRVGILGFSAGGHLASTAGTRFDEGIPQASDPIDRHSCRPDLMVLCYPVITLGPYRNHNSLVNLLGEDAGEELRDLLSNEKQVSDRTPPAFLWHTSDDEGVKVENSLLFAAALSKHKIPFELHSFESGLHGIGLASDHPYASTWTDLCARWLHNHGF